MTSFSNEVALAHEVPHKAVTKHYPAHGMAREKSGGTRREDLCRCRRCDPTLTAPVLLTPSVPSPTTGFLTPLSLPLPLAFSLLCPLPPVPILRFCPYHYDCLAPSLHISLAVPLIIMRCLYPCPSHCFSHCLTSVNTSTLSPLPIMTSVLPLTLPLPTSHNLLQTLPFHRACFCAVRGPITTPLYLISGALTLRSLSRDLSPPYAAGHGLATHGGSNSEQHSQLQSQCTQLQTQHTQLAAHYI